jgi:ribonuclease R
VLSQIAGAADKRHGPKRGKLLEVVGREDEPARRRRSSPMHTHGVPMGFSAEADAGSRGRHPPTLQAARTCATCP